MEECNLPTIFNEIQTCDNKKYALHLAKAVELIETSPGFIEVIHSIVLCKKLALPPRLTYFLRRIFEELNETSKNVVDECFKTLLGFCRSKNARVRCHSLRMMDIILQIEKKEIEPEYLQIIAERLFDRETCVRKEAIKICLLYQNVYINENLKIQNTLKDVIRYDQSIEVRRLCLSGIEINSTTINCVIERCLDTSASIRKIFWVEKFLKIDLKLIQHCQRIFLLKAGMLEREFDAKTHLMEGIVVLGLEEFVDLFYCQEPVYVEAIKTFLKNSNQKFELNRFTVSHINFMNVYYSFVEDNQGRDALKLMEIEQFLSILYNKCIDIENKLKTDSIDAENDIKIATGLFKMLSFYDIFTDDSRKSILSIIKHLLTKGNAKEIVEEAVILCKNVCSTDTVPFLGAIIKKTKGTVLCMSVCEYIMKHIPYGPIHDAIIQEIVPLDLGGSLNVLYWAIIQKPNDSLIQMYLNFMPNKRAIEGATDLVLLDLIEFSRIESCLNSQTQKFSENVVIPICKLLLSKKTISGLYLKFLLEIFYTSTTECILQYLSLFFYEYLSNEYDAFVEMYSEVLESIAQNQRTFVDQSLYWIGNCKSANADQKLFFNVCLYIINNYDALKNKKWQFFTLEKINVSPSWERVLTKKIIYLVTAIIRKRPRENVQAILTNLMSNDDGEPLSQEDFKTLKSMLHTDQ